MALPYPNIAAAAAWRTAIGIGSAPNDGLGDPLRTAFQRSNARDAGLELAVDQAAANFTDLDTRTVSLEGSAQFLNWRGDWATATAYVFTPGVRRDIFRDAATGDVYMVLQSHTSTSLAADEAAGKIVQSDAAHAAAEIAQVKTLVELPVADYVALRAYAGPNSRVYITGPLATAKPHGVAGSFQVDATDTTSADNGGTVIVGADGRRWKRDFSGVINVRWFGAMGNGVNDDTAEIAATIAAASPGGVVYFPPGTYNVAGTTTISSNGVKLIGAGERSTSIIQTTVDADTFVFSSCQWSSIEGMRISHSGTATGGYAVKFNKTGATGCFFCSAKNLFVENMWNGIHVQSSTETRVSSVHFRGMRGTIGVLFDGTGPGADASYRLVLEDIVCDTAGNGNTSIVWYVQDSWAYSLVIDRCTGLYGGFAFSMRDTLNTGSSYPVWCFAHDLECDHNQYGVVLDAGEGFYAMNSWIGSAMAGNGVTISPPFRGEVDIGNTRIMGNAQSGVLLSAGPVDVNIHDCIIGDNSAGSPAVHHGIVVAGGAQRFQIMNNRIGDLVGVAGNAQAYGLFIIGTTCTDYMVVGNNLKGNTTGSILDETVGGNKVVANNLT